MNTLRIWIDTCKEVGKRAGLLRMSFPGPWTLPFASPVFVGTGVALVVEREESGSGVGHELCLTGALVEVIETVVVMMGMSVMRLSTLRFGAFV